MKARWIVLGVVVGLPPLLVGAVVLTARSAPGQAWVVEQVIALIQPPEGRLSVRSVRTDLWSTIRIEGVSLRDRSGKELAGLDVAEADFSLRELLSGRVRVSRLHADGLRGDLTIQDGAIDVATIWGPPSTAPSTPWAGLGIDVIVERVDLAAPHAQVRIDGEVIALAGIELGGALAFVGDEIRLDGVTLLAASSTPALGDLRLTGAMRYGPDALDLESVVIDLGPHYASLSGSLGAEDDVGIHVDTLHVDTAALPWPVPVHGPFDATGDLGGRLDAPTLALLVGTPGGLIDVVAALDTRPERPTWQAHVETIGLAINPLVDDVPEVVVDLTVDAEGAGLGWPDDLDGHATIAAVAPVAGPAGSATLDARVDLSDGLAWVQDLVATTPTGALRADATVDLLGRVGTAEVHALDVALRDLRRFGVTGLGGDARLAGTVDAAWTGDAPEVRFVGDLDAHRLAYQGTTRVGRVRGPLAVHWADATATYTADLRADRLVAPSTTLSRARLTARGTASGAGAVRLTARVHGDTLVGGPVSVVSVDAHAQLARSRAGHLQTDVLFDTGAVAASRIAGDRARGHLSIDGDTLLATVDVFEVDRTVLGVDARGALAAGHYELPRLIFAPDAAQTWTGVGVQQVTLAPDGVDDLRVLLTSGDASIAASGRLHTGGETAVDVAVVDFGLPLLAAFDPAFSGYAGTVGVTGTARGRWDSIALQADGDVAGLVIPGAVRDLDAKIAVTGADGALTVAATASSEGAPLATLHGSIPASLDLHHPTLLVSAPLDLTVELAPGTGEGWNDVLVGARLPAMRGSGRLRLGGTLQDPNVSAIATVELPSKVRGADWLGVDVTLTTQAERLEVDALLRQGTDALATLRGGATVGLARVSSALLGRDPDVDLASPTTWVRDLDLALAPDGFRIEALSGFMAIPDGVVGGVTGEVHLRGSPVAPLLDGHLDLVDAKLDDLVVTAGALDFAPAPGGYTLAMDLGFGAEGDVHVGGFVPVDLASGQDLAAQLARPGLKVDVGGSGVPLRAISAVWPQLEEAVGTLHVAGTVTGSLATPVATLQASTRDAAFHLTSTGVTYDQVRFSLALDPTSVRLDDLFVRTSTTGVVPERGTMKGSAHAGLEGTTLGEWAGEITLDRTVISAFDDRRLRVANGTITLSGKPPDIVVGGSMVVDEARLHVDQRFFQGKTNRTLPLWLRVHRADSILADAVASAPTTDLPTWLTLTFTLDLARQTFLRAELPLDASLGNLLGPFATVTVDTQADGTLRIAGRDGRLSIVGQVLPIRGTTTLFGKPFAIADTSTISFTGADYAAPVLDLHAVYDTRGYGLVEATIRGVPDALTVELSSNDYPSQDDVISLLLIGKPASEVTVGEGASDGAAGAALSMLLNTLGQTGGKAASVLVAPDLLVVGDQTARVGKRIGRSIFVVVDWNNLADDQTDSILTLTVEISLWKAWQAEFMHGTAGQDSISLNWTKRY